jgi:CspA family cold shock protein
LTRLNSSYRPSNGCCVAGSLTIARIQARAINKEKGYGFISQEDGADLFVHYSNITGSGFKTLVVGQKVEFDVGQGRKGEEAQNVRAL